MPYQFPVSKTKSYPAHFEKGFVMVEIKKFRSYRVIYGQKGLRIKMIQEFQCWKMSVRN